MACQWECKLLHFFFFFFFWQVELSKFIKNVICASPHPSNLPLKNLPSGGNHKYINKYMFQNIYYSLVYSSQKMWRPPRFVPCCSRAIHQDILLCLPCCYHNSKKMGGLPCLRGSVHCRARSRSCHLRSSCLASGFWRVSSFPRG